MATVTPMQPAAPLFLPAPAEIYRFTIDQYDRMVLDGTIAEDEPVELLSGILVRNMPKKPKHSVITIWLGEELRGQLPPGWHIRQEQPLRIPDYDEPEPDLVLVRGAIMDYAGRHPDSADVALVGEVSETTLDRDQGEKCAAYARGGVPVYWIINLIDNRIEVYTDPNPAYGYRTRVGVDLNPVVDQIDDPVDRDSAPCIGGTFFPLVSVQCRLGDFTDQGDVRRVRMPARIVHDRSPDQNQVGFGLVVVGNSEWLLLSNMPARGQLTSQFLSQPDGDHGVFRLLGHIAYQNPAQQLNGLILGDRPVEYHPVILVNREPVDFGWCRQEQGGSGLHRCDGGHDRSSPQPVSGPFFASRSIIPSEGSGIQSTLSKRVSAITGRTRLRKLGQPHRLSFRPPGARLRLEDSSARSLAAWARPLRRQVPGGQPVPVAADQELTALVAAGAIGLGIVDVTHVGVPHAVAQSNLPGPAKRGRRRRRAVEHAVIGMKRGEMERDVRPELLDHPLRQLVELAVRVVLAGNQERRQLEPDRRFVLEVLEGLEHRRERARADLAVKSLGEGFEVDVGGVHDPVELGPWFSTHLAGGYGHGLDPLFA